MQDFNRVLELAIETGQIMLQSGAETHKAEEVMHNVCRGFGHAESEGYVTLTGIFLSLKDSSGNVSTSIKRIEDRSTDLEKISRITKLTQTLLKRNDSQSHSARHMTFDEYNANLIEITRKKQYPMWAKVLCGGLSCGCFTMLFGGSWRQFYVAVPAGILLRMFLLFLIRLRLNNFLLNALGAAFLVWVAKMAVTNIGLMNSDKIIIGGIMLLVPGLAITNAIRDTMAGDLVAGNARMMEAFFVSVAIATGAGTMLKLWSLIS
ncbi:MAG: hypothetical protein CVU48_01735 [Candidatus Cloacimonetes bacterium HGW-Cloacimonetes-1]|jgi:uncharacterized membrane protein YjjP (DUF1212 family)|nr:MAG: hypothetical protein CVU48_01735 [Candidatus Cloacimonetes bacterium HGW-Cloacimonetes-1]